MTDVSRLAHSVHSTPRSRINGMDFKDSGIRTGNKKKDVPKIHFNYSHSRMAPPPKNAPLYSLVMRRTVREVCKNKILNIANSRIDVFLMSKFSFVRYRVCVGFATSTFILCQLQQKSSEKNYHKAVKTRNGWKH